MCIISAREGWLPGMTGEIQPLPTRSVWKHECSLCYHSGKFVIWPLGMTENSSDEQKFPWILWEYLKLSENGSYSCLCWEWGDPETTPFSSQPAGILNLKNPGQNNTDYAKRVYRQLSLN